MLTKHRQQKIARRELRHKLKRKFGNLFQGGKLTLTIMRKMIIKSSGERRTVLRRLVSGRMGRTLMGTMP